MGYGDVVIESCDNFLDGLAQYSYNDDEIERVFHFNKTIELVALHLKIYKHSFYLEKDWNILEDIDWEKEAIEYVNNYFIEHYQ